MDVLIILGSKSDMNIGLKAKEKLDQLGIENCIRIGSAHRSPDHVEAIIKEADDLDLKVVIAVAGISAHLAGVIASKTLLPVIAVPVDGGSLKGIDALFSTVNMPAGVPVATVSLGENGGINAAVLAAEILAIKDRSLKEKLKKERTRLAESVIEADKNLRSTA